MLKYDKNILLKEYQSLIDKIPMGIGIFDYEGNVIISNKTMLETLGYSKEQLYEMGVSVLYANIKDREYLREKLQKEHKLRDYEVLMKKPDGEEYISLINIEMEEINGDKIFFTTIQDITNQKVSEEKLRESEQRYRALYKNIPVPTYTWKKENDDLVLIDYNDAGKAITRNKVQDVVGSKAKDVYSDRMYIAEDMLRCLNDKTTFSIESEYLIKVIEEMKYFNIKYAYTPPDLVLVHTEDITEKKKAELKLKESEKKYREAFTRAEFYKDLFAHDISNLLQGILSSSQLIEKKIKNPETLAQIKLPIEIIKDQVNRGSSLVQNVRKLSYIEKKNNEIKKIEIIKILKNIISNFKDQFKNLSINLTLNSNIKEIFIQGNESIRDVFENIIINGIKHNNNHKLEINIRISKETIDYIPYVKLEFIDNGIGIEDSRKLSLFQSGRSGAGKTMGIGLSLVKMIMDMYQGKIWVENKIPNDYSKGSNFILLIPENN